MENLRQNSKILRRKASQHKNMPSGAKSIQVPLLLYREDSHNRFEGTITKYCSELSKQSIAAYNKHVRRAVMFEKSGTMNEAIREYLAALEICDEERNLHQKLFLLGKEEDCAL